VEEVRELDFRLARQSPDTANLSGKLKALLAQQAYSSPPLIKSRAIAVERIRSLFQYLIDNPGQVSAGYRQHLADTPVHRVVCDYIAGMTDAYFVKVHAELVGP
jgi:dGTPase